MTVYDISPILELFTDAMKTKMEDNSHKVNKPKLPVPALMKKLRIEVEELAFALDHETPEAARWECADVANFCMLIWKRLYYDTDIDGIRKDATYTPTTIHAPASGESFFTEPTSKARFYAKDFELQGMWSPQAGIDIMMWRHKPTNTIFFEDHERTRALSGAFLMPDWIKEQLPK